MGLRERKQEMARREIVEAAFELFSNHGFDDTTVEMIAERAFVSPRTIYRYFESKERIVFDDFDDETDRLIEVIRQHCAGGVSARALFGAFAEHLGRRADEPHFSILAGLMRDNVPLMTRADAWRRQLHHRIADALAELRDADHTTLEDKALAGMAVAVSAIAIQEWAANDRRGDLAAMVLQVGRTVAEAAAI